MKIEDVLPPGSGPCDPYVKDLDAIGFALERLLTHLSWIGEHCATFQACRHTNPEQAEGELGDLMDSHRQAMRHLARLTGLLLAGYSIDPQKRVPHDLTRWLDRLDASTLRPYWLRDDADPTTGEADR